MCQWYVSQVCLSVFYRSTAMIFPWQSKKQNKLICLLNAIQASGFTFSLSQHEHIQQWSTRREEIDIFPIVFNLVFWRLYNNPSSASHDLANRSTDLLPSSSLSPNQSIFVGGGERSITTLISFQKQQKDTQCRGLMSLTDQVKMVIENSGRGQKECTQPKNLKQLINS